MAAAQLPGFTEGLVAVQDEGAQWAAVLLAPQAGERVLDACAAPGGKALHLLDRCDAIELLALDRDPMRCEQMRSEFRRAGADPHIVIEGDASALAWWDGRPFQRILLDAPCSGTGTLRRHPDIKLLKHASDLPAYRAIQSRLLAGLWRVLQTGGRLLYCTCSVLTAENDCVIDDFITATPNAALIPIDAEWGIRTRHGRQLLPQVGGPDGFYYTLIEKR
jgi:16S rRNA (cytosine967-C5)-methyltransferase